MFFVNLTLRAVRQDPGVLDEFLERGVNPELGLDPLLMDDADEAWHHAVAERLRSRGLVTALHLPFFDLQPGSADRLIRSATRERLVRAARVARIYAPVHLVGHANYDHMLYVRSYDQWLRRAKETWLALLESWPGHPPLYLENTFEPEPWMVTRLVESLADEGARVGLCLDVGHWYSFARGKERGNLRPWLEGFAPLLGHAHLHDNDGDADRHLGLGQGGIPWEDVFTGLEQLGLAPSITFEPHSPEAYMTSMACVADKPEWFERLGVCAPGGQAGATPG